MAEKSGIGMTPDEAHRLWHIAIAGKEGKPTDFGVFVSIFGLSATTTVHKTKAGADNENAERQKQIVLWLRSWADNLEGK